MVRWTIDVLPDTSITQFMPGVNSRHDRLQGSVKSKSLGTSPKRCSAASEATLRSPLPRFRTRQVIPLISPAPLLSPKIGREGGRSRKFGCLGQPSGALHRCCPKHPNFRYFPFPQMGEGARGWGCPLYQPAPLRYHGILPIMAAAALAIMQGSLGYYQSNFHSVPQAYQAVTQPGCAVKRLDLIPQVA